MIPFSWSNRTAFLAIAVFATAAPAQAVEVIPPLETRITEALERPIHADWKEAPLVDVLQDLSAAANVLVVIDKQALQDEGIDPSTPVSLHFGATTISQTLPFLLRPLQLTLICREHDWYVTSHAKSEEMLTTHVYDIDGLARGLRGKIIFRERFNGAPGFITGPSPLETVQGGGFWQIADNNAGLATLGISLPVRRSPEILSVEAALSQLLVETTSGLWEDIDGSGGTITRGDGRLTIRQTQQAHFEITGILTAIELLAHGRLQAKSLPAVPRPNYPANADAEVAKALQRPMKFTLRDVALDEALKKVCAEEKIPLWFDITALQDEGIDPATAISVEAAGRPLRSVLEDILDPLNLLTVIEEGRLVVTSKTRAEELLVIRAYRVTDIREAAEPEQCFTLLKNATSDLWEDSDGTGGMAVQLTRDLLVVRQTQHAHAEIEALFQNLRALQVSSADTANEERKPAETTEYRLYPVHDAAMLPALEKLIPELYGGPDAWPEGSLRRMGDSALFVRQTHARHADVEALFGALESVHNRLHPAPAEPKPSK